MKRKLLISLVSIVAMLVYSQTGFAHNMLLNGKAKSLSDSNTATVRDARQLTWTAPKSGETYYVGDSVVFRWTSENVDSILIAAKGKQDSGYFFLTVKGNPDSDHPDLAPVPAAQGYYGLRIPLNASVDTMTFYLFDAADTTFYTTVEPIYLKDTIAPTVESLAPNAGSMDFPATAPISVSFSEEIVAGTGQLHIKKSDGTTVENIDASKLNLQGDNFYVNPNPQLVPGQSYYIEMDAGLVKDLSGNEFAGLSGKSWSFTVATATLYFSEYIEGSGNNKALEIYNPTDHTVNLGNYMIASSYNGNNFGTDSASLYYFPHGAVLKSGAVFVLANSGASSDILKVTNDTLAGDAGGHVVSFTGNDARVLIRKLSNSDWAWLDVIGNGGQDPGTGWDVAGVAAATKGHTLLRKASVKMGTSDWGTSAGSDSANSQWIVKPKNYFANLGKPTPQGTTGISNINLSNQIQLYPNPGNGQLHINLNNTIKGKVRVRIMDITGRVIYEHVFNYVMNQTLPVDISNEPSNLYFISISDANNTVVKKFLKR
ncbi:MAG: hypothetical protein IEMM0006_2039 [bacterium]|nr:MAG: hypothetical protein IEMM0006_2039 [bacterium]